MFVVWYLNDAGEWRYQPFIGFDEAWDAYSAETALGRVSILDHDGWPVVVNDYAREGVEQQ